MRRRHFLLAPTALAFIPGHASASLPTFETPFPIPGFLYQIKPGDVLLHLASRAYGTRLGAAENLAAARLINDHPRNAEFRRIVAGEQALFPRGRISFLPRFGASRREFAVPFIPLWKAPVA